MMPKSRELEALGMGEIARAMQVAFFVVVPEIIKYELQRFIEETIKELREELAELEHKQWESWSKYTADQLIYKEEKDKDRIWADKVLEKIEQKAKQWLKENFNANSVE